MNHSGPDSTLLLSTPLFHGFSEDELSRALAFLDARRQAYEKDSLILHSGDSTRQLGIVLSGSVTIENEDLWGSRTILAFAGAGDLFAESYAILLNEPLLVDVRANESSLVLFLRTDVLFSSALPAGVRRENGTPPGDLWQLKFTQNLLQISARKNLTLSGRSFHTSPKTIRGRVMAYLDSMSLKAGSRQFDIPFDRQQMADYLNVDRSALSKELGKMKSDGLIDCRRNHFRIL